MEDNVAESQFFEYNAAGLVSAVYTTGANRDAGNISSAKAIYTYDESGFRIKKELDDGTIVWYIRDAGGNILSIYSQTSTTDVKRNEVPLYGAGRLGTAYCDAATGIANKYLYELTDHLGNVRATVSLNSENELEVESYSDYYPFGWEMPGRSKVASTAYRFGYQGQFSEKDPETGLNQFEARLFDTRIGRWLTTDPAGQYWSPYVGMGNNPVNGVDPDGRDDIIQNEKGQVLKRDPSIGGSDFDMIHTVRGSIKDGFYQIGETVYYPYDKTPVQAPRIFESQAAYMFDFVDKFENATLNGSFLLTTALSGGAASFVLKEMLMRGGIDLAGQLIFNKGNVDVADVVFSATGLTGLGAAIDWKPFNKGPQLRVAGINKGSKETIIDYSTKFMFGGNGLGSISTKLASPLKNTADDVLYRTMINLPINWGGKATNKLLK